MKRKYNENNEFISELVVDIVGCSQLYKTFINIFFDLLNMSQNMSQHVSQNMSQHVSQHMSQSTFVVSFQLMFLLKKYNCQIAKKNKLQTNFRKIENVIKQQNIPVKLNIDIPAFYESFHHKYKTEFIGSLNRDILTLRSQILTCQSEISEFYKQAQDSCNNVEDVILSSFDDNTAPSNVYSFYQKCQTNIYSMNQEELCNFLQELYESNVPELSFSFCCLFNNMRNCLNRKLNFETSFDHLQQIVTNIDNVITSNECDERQKEIFKIDSKFYIVCIEYGNMMNEMNEMNYLNLFPLLKINTMNQMNRVGLQARKKYFTWISKNEMEQFIQGNLEISEICQEIYCESSDLEPELFLFYDFDEGLSRHACLNEIRNLSFQFRTFESKFGYNKNFWSNSHELEDLVNTFDGQILLQQEWQSILPNLIEIFDQIDQIDIRKKLEFFPKNSSEAMFAKKQYRDQIDLLNICKSKIQKNTFLSKLYIKNFKL